MQTFYKVMAYFALYAAVAFLMYMLVSCASLQPPFQSHEDRKKNWTSKDLYESMKMQGVI